MNTEISDKLNKLFETTTHPTIYAITTDGAKIKYRLFKSCDNICYFKKGSHRKGYHFETFGLKDITPFVQNPRKSKDQQWRDAWNKVRSKLVASGLWESVVKEIDVALDLGYTTMKRAYDEYWAISCTSDDSLVSYFVATYPTLTEKNDKGEPFINTTILYHYAKLPKVEKMRFHKDNARNEAVLQAIQKAMNEKTTFHYDGRTNYDISLEYAPEKGNRMWFSKEFKGCMNGHYYLGLDATHALWTEDD